MLLCPQLHHLRGHEAEIINSTSMQRSSSRRGIWKMVILFLSGLPRCYYSDDVTFPATGRLEQHSNPSSESPPNTKPSVCHYNGIVDAVTENVSGVQKYQKWEGSLVSWPMPQSALWPLWNRRSWTDTVALFITNAAQFIGFLYF